MSNPSLTRATGCPVAHNKNSLTAGPHGPALLQDVHLIEKLQYFDRERTPPRNVHPLGTGAYGHFTVTNPEITKYTCASLFSNVGKKTELFARLSGTFTLPGEAETRRDVRGFAIKFYTEDGNWDLMCINMPVFNCRDGKIGPEAIHAFKRDPQTDEWNTETIWNFVVKHPESLHQALMLYTDREGTPMSYRMMHAYGCNTYSFYNAKKERFWVKFHLRSEQGVQGFSSADAKLIAGVDPNWLRRDLREAIEHGNYPRWKLCCQIMKEEEGYRRPETFDCTKVWKHSEFPLIEIGVVELNRLPIDYHAEVEQVAFSPANVVPGIGFSPDRLLQSRLFIYSDTQFHRLGPNYHQIPINRPHGMKNDLNTQYMGGQHQSLARNVRILGDLKPDPRYLEPAYKTDGAANYYDIENEGSDMDYYAQCRDFYNILSEDAKRALAFNLSESLAKVRTELRTQALQHLKKVNDGLVREITEKLTNKEQLFSTPGDKTWKQLHSRLHPEVKSA